MSAGFPFHVRYDYSAAGARRSVEDSLQRLGLARIDVAYIHDPAEDSHGTEWREVFATAMQGAARALSDMRSEGLIGGWGLGVNRVEPCLLALREADPDLFLLAGRYTLLDTTALDSLFPECQGCGVRVVAGRPVPIRGFWPGGTTFESGLASPEMIDRVHRIAALCARHAVDIKAAALQFCAAHPVVATVIPGARNPGEVRQNADSHGGFRPRGALARAKTAPADTGSCPNPAPNRPGSRSVLKGIDPLQCTHEWPVGENEERATEFGLTSEQQA